MAAASAALDPRQQAAGKHIHGLDQVAQLTQVDRGLGGVLRAVSIGVDITGDDGSAQLRGGHRGPRGQVAQDGGVGPARPRLELLRANEDLRVVPELVGYLEHRHEAGIHAHHVHLASEEAVGLGEHALELLVIEAVASPVVVGDAPTGRRAVQQALLRGVEERPAALALGGHWGTARGCFPAA